MRDGAASTRYPPGYADFYLDGDHAWQAGVYGSTTSCNDHLSTFATSDGGNTWKPSGRIPLNLSAGYQTNSVQIGFTSSQDGWLWVPTGTTTTGDPFFTSITDANLYLTSDGGQTWRQVASLSSSQLKGFAVGPASNCKPSPGDIAFASSSVGWVSVTCTDTILVTRDRGAHWNVQNFPTSGMACPCYVQLPTFLDASHGFTVASDSTNNAGADRLLMTTDSGTTWRESAHPGTGYLLEVAAVDANRLFALVTPPGWTKGSNAGFELYLSLDGALTWTLINHDVPASWPPGFLQFVDQNHGFESNTNGAAELLVTDDGGKSWKSITPAVE